MDDYRSGKTLKQDQGRKRADLSREYFSLETHDVIEKPRDMRIRIPTLLAEYAATITNENAQNEFLCLAATASRTGECSYHTLRIEHAHGSQVRRILSKAVRTCPHLKRVSRGRKGVSCAVYQLTIPGAKIVETDLSQEAPTDNGYDSPSRVSFPKSLTSSLFLPAAWLIHRALCWTEWCASLGIPNLCDFLGVSGLAKAVFTCLSKVEIPFGFDFLKEISDLRKNESRKSKKEWALAYWCGCHDGSMLRVLRQKAGRCYHALTNCPKALRRRLRLDGQRLGEVDLSCSYWTLIASRLLFHVALLCVVHQSSVVFADDLRPQRLQSTIASIQPMTGIVLWSTNEAAATAPIQLEYAYIKYNEVVQESGEYDWQSVERLLNDVASRKHQAIIRWHDTYVGEPAGVPAFIKRLPNYRETNAKSENKQTGFPDWSNQEWKSFVLEFYARFAEKYDRDPRLAFVQAGFGLWAEYHIYDGPMKLGVTFPDKSFQLTFVRHLASHFRETPWMISVDAAGDHTPFAENTTLSELRFGLFDDSFNQKRHKKENEPNWRTLGMDRWKHSPTGGEFSFFARKDQKEALSPDGPYGIPFAEQAAKFHVSFIIGDDQPRFQSSDVVRNAGMACGYRFKVNRFLASSTASELDIQNTGIAPIYFDAFPAVDGVRSETTLRGLLPGETRRFRVAAGGRMPVVTIECDRLVPGQKIEYEADLP